MTKMTTLLVIQHDNKVVILIMVMLDYQSSSHFNHDDAGLPIK
jgi:hypothetical protein